MTRTGLLAAAALALPVVGAVGSIALNEAGLADATEWRVPITGYDPRDPLRGRFIRFQYAWRFAGGATACTDGACRLCREDGGAAVRVAAPDARCPAAIDPRASGLVPIVDAGPARRVAAGTRLWVSEAHAPELEAQLRGRPMVAVARLTRGGRLVPDRLEPR